MDTIPCPLFQRPRDIGASFAYVSLSSIANIVEAVPAQPTFSARRGPPILHEFPEYDNLLGSDTGITPGVFTHTPNINLADEPHIMSKDVQPDNDTEFDSSKNH
jgi:hypothetical protein